MKSNPEPMRWVMDHQECLYGNHGDWWRLRAERAIAMVQSDWVNWRRIRRNETPPAQGNLQIIK